MIIQSSWRAAGLVIFIAACLVVVVTVSLLLPGGDSDNSTTASLARALLIDADPLVVTDVRVVQAATDDGARDQCSTMLTNGTRLSAEWIIAGKNLNGGTISTTSNNAYTYLCMRQARVREVKTNGSSSLVLQSLRVLTTGSCPLPMTTIYRSPTNVTICSEQINATMAFATGVYVSSLTTTTEKWYSEDVPGWTTEDTSIGLAPSTPVFLSYRRPVRPIVSSRVMHDVRSDAASAVCNQQLGVTWEQAGSIVVSSSTTTSTVLCIERNWINTTTVPSMLEDMEVIPSSCNCSDGFGKPLQLTDTWTTCFKYTNHSKAAFVSELRLMELPLNTDALPISPLSDPNPSGIKVHSIGSSASGASMVVVARIQSGVSIVSNSMASITFNVPKPPLLARSNASQTNLRRNSDRLSFKIVQLADLHYTGDASHKCRHPPQEMIDNGQSCTEADTTAFVEKVLDTEQPDLVVFTGDNVEVAEGNSLLKAIEAAVSTVEARKIPYAVVFGNHDDENGHTRAEMTRILMEREYSRMQWGAKSIDGIGNYALSVEAPKDGPWGPAGTKVFRMYFLDSHGYPNKTKYPGVQSTYDWIKPSQIAYYKAMVKNESSIVPAVMFFHIPIPEYASVGSSTTRRGEKNEAVMSSEMPSNLFSALVEMGDVKATFVGHDHVNEYCYGRQGVQLCYGGGAGFAQAYGSATFARRSRVIEWSVDGENKRRITSWKRHYGRAFETRQEEEVLYADR